MLCKFKHEVSNGENSTLFGQKICNFHWIQIFFFKVFIFFLKLFILLLVVGSCFGCTVRLVGSLFPYQGLNPDPQQWKCGVLTIGPPGSSPKVPIFKDS